MNLNEQSRAFVLRPALGFEQVYQGQDGTTPIPLFVADADGQTLPLESDVPREAYDPLLTSFVPVPRGSTITLYFPVIRSYNQGNVLVTAEYHYQIKWRLRLLGEQLDEPRLSWSLFQENGVPDQPTLGPTIPKTRRLVIPGFSGPQIVPAHPSGAQLDPGYVSRGVRLHDEQGRYAVTALLQASPGDAATYLAVQGYQPVQIPAMGDEISISVHRADTTSTWNFFTIDQGLSYVLGTGVADTQRSPKHPPYPGIGVYMTTGVRSTTP